MDTKTNSTSEIPISTEILLPKPTLIPKQEPLDNSPPLSSSSPIVATATTTSSSSSSTSSSSTTTNPLTSNPNINPNSAAQSSVQLLMRSAQSMILPTSSLPHQTTVIAPQTATSSATTTTTTTTTASPPLIPTTINISALTAATNSILTSPLVLQSLQSQTTATTTSSTISSPSSSVANTSATTTTATTPSAQSQSDIIMQKLWNELQQLVDTQANVMKNPNQESYLIVSSIQKALQDKTNQILRDISTIWCKTLLQPQDIGKVRDAVQDLAVIQRQLEVLRSELETLPYAATNLPSSNNNNSTTTNNNNSNSSNNSINGSNGSGGGNLASGGVSIPSQPSGTGAGSVSPKVSAALVVKRQPFPLVLRKGEQLGEQDSIIVRLVPLSLSAEVMTITSQVRVQVVCDSHQTSRSLATHELIQPLAINIDPTTLVARFTLHFLDGTKNTPVSLRFSLQILVQNSVPVTLESELTAPFIVITHKDQWKGAAGTMLKRDAFLHQYEVPWAQLANTLQTHFLRATKQAQAAGTHRPLSEFDLVYLNKKFFGGKPVVDQSQFDAFWQWYGAALDTIRHQRPILGLWWQGLVYGFASKDDVNVALAREAQGTFLIRFSESFPGSFAIAYTTGEGVKHYLVTPQDHALHKTLPDFIVAQPQFVNVLQLQITQDPATGKAKLQLVRVSKMTAFESFCTKKPPQARPLPPGYSSL